VSRSRWYFYNGRVPVPVKLTDGRIYAVRPRGYVFTDADGIRKYGNKFRPCARPDDADSILSMLDIETDHPPKVFENSSSPLAESVTELGKAANGRSAPEPPAAPGKAESAPPKKTASRKRRKVGTEK
jgi:hypothetical protein